MIVIKEMHLNDFEDCPLKSRRTIFERYGFAKQKLNTTTDKDTFGVSLSAISVANKTEQLATATRLNSSLLSEQKTE